jgi:DNA-binding response OmpR family regulator
MIEDRRIHLYVADRPVLSSLQFLLALEGFAVVEGNDPHAASVIVADQGYEGDGLAFLVRLRAAGCGVPAICLVTNPTDRLRARAAAAGAVIVEKPLLGDELTSALNILSNASPVP